MEVIILRTCHSPPEGCGYLTINGWIALLVILIVVAFIAFSAWHLFQS